MIRIRRPDAVGVLSTKTLSYLGRRSTDSSAYPANDTRIDRDWTNFLRTVARSDVESALNAHTWGKCAYCEAVAAKDIEHFYPKSTYPQRMFSWDNFLRGCKNCNNAKLAHFPLDGAGHHVLLNPCMEEPLDFFAWDFMTGATGLSSDPVRQPRAFQTRHMFALDQEALREERRIKALETLYFLSRVIEEDPITVKTRDRLYDHLQPHRPWLGIVRQLLTRPSGPERLIVEAALAKLPEIRTWASDWL